MQLCHAHETLVIPKWMSSLFWPVIWNKSKNRCHGLVQEFVEYKNHKQFFKSGLDKSSIFAQESFLSNVLLIIIDFI